MKASRDDSRQEIRNVGFMKLPIYPRSNGLLKGWCGALLNEDTECILMAGHLNEDLPHMSRGPSGIGRWIEYDDDGIILRQGNGQYTFPPLKVNDPKVEVTGDRYRVIYEMLKHGDYVQSPGLRVWVAQTLDILDRLGSIPEYYLVAKDLRNMVCNAQDYLHARKEQT